MYHLFLSEDLRSNIKLSFIQTRSSDKRFAISQTTAESREGASAESCVKVSAMSTAAPDITLSG